MLEQLRRNSRSFIIWVLFGIIIAVFIISFGPQASSGALGCGHSSDFALAVKGDEVSQSSWRFAVNGSGTRGDDAYRDQLTADRLVERELLAQAAYERGFRVSDDAVNQAIASGEFYILGTRIKLTDGKTMIDFATLENYARRTLGLASVANLVEEQKREHLAEIMRHALLTSGTISDEEARAFYIQENTTITADYVKFDVQTYKNALDLTEDDVARYAADHEDELKAAWEDEKSQWQSDKARLLVRHIFVELPTDEADTSAAAPAGGESATPTETTFDKTNRARKEIDAARARIAAGEDFGAVAREVSDDVRTRSRGGLLGWRPADSLGYGKEVVDAAAKLEVGQVSEPVETARGFHLLKLEEKSDKGLTFDQKKLDLAGKLATDFYARALAKRDAEAAVAAAQGGQKLAALFEPKASPGRTPPTSLPSDLPPEILEQLERQLQQQGAGGTLPIELPDSVELEETDGDAPTEGAPSEEPPADDTEADGETAGDKTGFIWQAGPIVLAQEGGEPAKVPPATTVAPATTAAPAATAAPTGTAATKRTPRGANRARATATTTAVAAPQVTTTAAAEDGLPRAEVEKPGLESVGPAPRSVDFLAGVGTSKELLSDLFDTLEVGSVSTKVYPVSGASDAFVVIELTAREDADLSKFAEESEDLKVRLAYQEGIELLSSWLIDRCHETAKAGEIVVNAEYITQNDPERQFLYQPCATFGPNSVMGQIYSRGLP